MKVTLEFDYAIRNAVNLENIREGSFVVVGKKLYNVRYHEGDNRLEDITTGYHASESVHSKPIKVLGIPSHVIIEKQEKQ